MSLIADPAEEQAHSVRHPVLEGRIWQPARRHTASRLDVVRTVDDWMPYPISRGLVAIDLAVASLEADDEPEAFRYLNLPAVLDVLAKVMGDALGTGDLAQRRSLLRSRTILGLHRADLAALNRLAQWMGPRLKALFAELDAEEGLLKRARSTRLQTQISTEVPRLAAQGLMGDERPVTHLDTAPIDLGIVPPRVFGWDGPERNELRLIRTEGETTMEVRVEVHSPDALPDDYIAFVIFGDRTAEAPLRWIGEKRVLGATVDFGPSGTAEPGYSPNFGIRHRDVSREWARARISREVRETRYLVEAWARFRFDRATRAVARIVDAEKPAPIWVTSVPDAARAAQTVLAESHRALNWEMGSLAAGTTLPLRENEAASRAIGTSLIDASQWDADAALVGPERPLLSETYFVVGSDPVSVHRNSKVVWQ